MRVLVTGGRFLYKLTNITRNFSYLANMEKHEVVPDVIPVAPAEVATVKYGNLALDLGNELTPTQVKVI